jgi:arylsulfatase A-like enzyme
LVVHYPKVVAPADVDEPVSHLDVLPTILELSGLPPHPAFQGQSFASVEAHAKARVGIFMNTQGFRDTEGVICFPWKLWIDRSAGQEVRLYHLGDDPDEMKNLARERADVSRALSRMLSAQMKAQLEYHDATASGTLMRGAHFAPRLLSCPDLPAH